MTVTKTEKIWLTENRIESNIYHTIRQSSHKTRNTGG